MVWIYLSAALLSSAPKPFAVQFAESVAGREVTVCIDGSTVETTFAGKLGFRDANHSWVSVCADVRSPVRQGQYFAMTAMKSTDVGGRITLAGNIVARYFNEATSADQCAGLQLAVWKAVEDGTDEPNFLSGHFQAKASYAVLAYAQQYYSALHTPGTAVFLLAGAGAGAGGGGGQGAGGQGGSGGGAAGGGVAGGGGGGGQSQLSSGG